MEYFKKNKSFSLLIIFLIIGTLLRFYDLGNNPPSMYGDELTIAYDAYSISQTGRDQTGQFLPWTFSLGGGRPPGYVYFSIPFIALFGPTAIATRALSALSGVGLIVLMFLVGRKLFNDRVGLAAAFLMTFSPWSLSMSRGGFEAHFALFLAMLGFAFYLYSSQKKWFLLWSAVSFGISIHTYQVYKLLTPLFVILMVLTIPVYKKEQFNKSWITLASVLILIFSLAILGMQILTSRSETRFLNINIFSNEKLEQSIIQKINYERQINYTAFSGIFHNKYLEYFQVIGQNYLNHFSANYLFLLGDENPRHNSAATGELLLVQLPLLIAGIGVLLFKAKMPISLFLFGWLLLAPAASTIIDKPHALRSNLLLPVLTLVSALGLILITDKFLKYRRILIYGIVILILIQVIFLSEQLYILNKYKYSNFLAFQGRHASELAIKQRNNYQNIFITDRIDSINYAFPVYAKIPPQEWLAQLNNKITIGKYQFKKFGNIYLGEIPDSDAENFLKQNVNGSYLYIGPHKDKNFLSNYETEKGLDGLDDLAKISNK